VLPADQIQSSPYFASTVLEMTWGSVAAKIFTVTIVITAFGSVFAGLLGGSRVPYEAARDKVFLTWFAKLHPRMNFPTLGLFAMGVITAIGSLFTLTDVINMALAVLVLVQGIAQVAALVVLRRRQPTLRRPYKMWLYPLPAIIVLAGWIYIYKSATWESIWLSLGWLGLGIVAFLIWAGAERTWPFGPKDVNEQYATDDSVPATAG
jgi:amino acid transporter